MIYDSDMNIPTVVRADLCTFPRDEEWLKVQT